MSAQGANGEAVIQLKGVSKRYQIWSCPSARLRVPLWRELYRVLPLERLGLSPLSERIAPLTHPFHALDHLDLEVAAGQCLGIIGRNGSGKSTLLQIIAGILQPSSGSVSVHGRVAALLELGAGFDGEFTGRENVYLNAAIYGFSREQTEALFPRIEAFAEIGEFIDQKVKTYSSGMVVRLAFSVLAHLDPDILIIDEALAVGDSFFVQKCMRWLQEFVKTRTVILVSHDMAAITRFCDRVVWIDKGRIQFIGSPRRATELYLQSHYEAVEAAGAETSAAEALPSDRSAVIPDDQRQEAFRQSGVHDLPVFDFTAGSDSFGEGKIRITSVKLEEVGSDAPMNLIRGGEMVRLSVEITAREPVVSPIIGFGVKNRHGQELFHDNTYLSSWLNGQAPLELQAGEKARAVFEFVFPYLPAGDHFLFAAVAMGTHEQHQQQHWIHEAIKLTPATDRITLGLLGLPMQRVEFYRVEGRGEEA